jgi:hypothetical protein
MSNAARGFRLLFSAPFPAYRIELVRLRSEYRGTWYRWTATNMEEWLCPALAKYFAEPPAVLYARTEPLYPGRFAYQAQLYPGMPLNGQDAEISP